MKENNFLSTVKKTFSLIFFTFFHFFNTWIRIRIRYKNTDTATQINTDPNPQPLRQWWKFSVPLKKDREASFFKIMPRTLGEKCEVSQTRRHIA